MSSISKALFWLSNDFNHFCDSLVVHCFKWLPDRLYLKLRFRFKLGYWPDFQNPVDFNEKINWLKLYYRKPEFTQLVDKYSVKQYVTSVIGAAHVIPTIGVWESPNAIPFDTLPDKFVLKTTHSGGNTGVVICKDKTTINIEDIVIKLKESLRTDVYKTSREWPYKNVVKRIIAEPYLEDDDTHELRDYKFFCFNGEVKAMFVATERQSRPEPFFDFFDADFNHLNIRQGHPNSPYPIEKPRTFEQMKEIANKLSKGHPFLRVDLYEANNRVYFGEITFYHFAGMVPMEPPEWNSIFGGWIVLPA